MLRAIGFWISNVQEEEFCAPQEVVGILALTVRRQLADYLDAGSIFEKYRGFSWCRFDCSISEEKMGSCDLTDGVWVWPQGLSHYVREHGIILPDEFVAHAMEGSVLTTTEKSVDFEFWKQWCSSNRNERFIMNLQTARLNMQAEIQEYCLREASGLEQKTGLSETKCIWAGCQRRAMIGMAICGLHAMESQKGVTASMISGRLLMDVLSEEISHHLPKNAR